MRLEDLREATTSAGICFEDFLRPRCPSRMEEALCEDDMEGVTRTTWKALRGRHGHGSAARAIADMEACFKFVWCRRWTWWSGSGIPLQVTPFRFVGLIRSFALEMLILSYTIQSFCFSTIYNKVSAK